MKSIGPHPVTFWEMFDNCIFGEKTLIFNNCWFPWYKCFYQGRQFQATNMAPLNVKSRRDHCSCSTTCLHQSRITSRAQIRCSFSVREHWHLNIHYFHFKYNFLTWVPNWICSDGLLWTVTLQNCTHLRVAGVDFMGLDDADAAIPWPRLMTIVLD